MEKHEIIFETYLNHKGLKYTLPRKLILETVFDLHMHFDAEQLYDLIRNISRSVSRATVYRTIPLLEEAGLIQRSLRNEARDTFEHILGHPSHAHWVCKACGVVVETDMRDVEMLLQDKSRAGNFTINNINLQISGWCRKCQRRAHEPYRC
jgi:Fur family transcriptional regulator, ferric uptake regulator